MDEQGRSLVELERGVRIHWQDYKLVADYPNGEHRMRHELVASAVRSEQHRMLELLASRLQPVRSGACGIAGRSPTE